MFVVEVLDPDGKKVGYYGGNVMGETGAAQSSFYLALNDKAGCWRVRVRDVASGVVAEKYLMVE